jgi:hypothetical protein
MSLCYPQKMNGVVDLCGSDDEKDPVIIDLECDSNIPSVARAPTVSLLSDDDDDDDDNVQIIPPTPKRKRRHATATTNTNSPEVLVWEDNVEMDSKPAAKATKNIINTNASIGSASPKHSSGSKNNKESPPKPKTTTPLDSVYEVFPDVDRIHAQMLLFEQQNNIGIVMSVLADGKYPKQKRVAASASTASSVIVKRTRDLPKYDYLSPSSFEPTKEYIRQATQQLIYQFPFLSEEDGVKRLMKEHKQHYSIVREFVLNALLPNKNNNSKKAKISEEEELSQYYALNKVLASNRPRPNPQQLARLGVTYIIRYNRRPKTAPTITNPILQDEIRHNAERLTERIDIVEQKIKRLQARKVSQQTGTAMECSCCFDQVAIDEMVACRDEGHLFCVDCIQRYAESQIFSSGNLGIDKKTGKPALELLCCHGDGCQSAFQELHLEKALPYKTLEKYNELQFQAAVEQAGIRQDLW